MWKPNHANLIDKILTFEFILNITSFSDPQDEQDLLCFLKYSLASNELFYVCVQKNRVDKDLFIGRMDCINL